MLPATLPAVLPADGDCQVYLDARPDGCTLLAQVRLGSCVVLDAETLPDVGLAEHDRELLEGTLRRVDDFLERVVQQCHQALTAGDAVREENRQLRAALAECVSACAPLLDHLEQGGCEGAEADQARAWLALDAARQTLAVTPALPHRADVA